MTHEETRNWYAEQVEWYKREIAWTTNQIEWTTRQMERERAEVRELREFVWSKGVLTEIEWNLWCSSDNEFPEIRKYKNERRRLYMDRKKNEAKLKYYEEVLRRT